MTRLLLVTPESWRRLPLRDDAALARAVEALVARQFAGVDDQPLLRRSATADLLAQARAAREGGGLEMYLSTEVVAGLPVSLSLVVGHPPQAAGPEGLRGIARALAEPGVEVALVDLPCGRAVRRRRVARPAGLDAVGAPADAESVLVDFFLLSPEDDLVLLSFASPLEPLADALAELFEAVASTASWEQA